MRIYSLIIILFLTCHCLLGQSNQHVVVLSDVSGSVNKTAAREAKNLISDLVNGQFSKQKFPNWNFSSAYNNNLKRISQGQGGQSLMGKNRKAILMWVGEKQTIYSNTYNRSISDPNSDFPAFMDAQYPTRFTDQDTYLTLARAEAAKQAKIENIKNYVLIEATDSDDDRGRGTYSASERDLIDEYDAQGKVNSKKVGVIHYEGPNARNYKISIWSVEHLNFNPPGVTAPSTPGKGKARLTLNGVSKSDKSPKEYEKGKRTFSWGCSKCDGASYRVVVTKKSAGKYAAFQNQPKLKSRASRPMELGPGVYKISVSTTGLDQNVSDSGYFEVKGSSGAGFFWFLLIVAAIGGGFYLYSKNRNSGSGGTKRPKNQKSEDEDIFSPSPSSAGDDPFA